jgi:carbamoyl-phosphate synthase large subunit
MHESRPHIADLIKNGDIQIVINTGIGRRSSLDGYHIRRGALTYNIPYTTTISGARAVTEAIAALQKAQWGVRPLQEYYKK